MTTREAGSRIGPYVVESLLGMGGMGAVYRAHDGRLGRTVALKVVRPGREDRTGVDPADRLLAEARAAAALRHPHVVEIWDAGIAEDSGRYVAMEYVEGKPLRAFVGDRTVPEEVRLRWLVEVASALEAAHRAGLVHRDVKPENVMIDREGRARVLDLGIAKRFAHDVGAPTAEHPSLETAEGRVIGTLAYMAPEQLAGGVPGPAWDQFAWGVMAYELLTGVHPRQTVAMPGPTAHLTQTPRLPSELAPGVGFEVAVCVLRAMAPDAGRRFASMAEAAAALRGARGDEAPRAEAEPVAPGPAASSSPESRWPARTASVGVAGVVVALALVAGGALYVLPAMLADRAPRSREMPPPPSATAAPTVVAAALPPSSASPSAPPSAAEARVPPAASVSARRSTRAGCICSTPAFGALCPASADRSLRLCKCAYGDYHLSSAPDRREFVYRGRGLSDGQPCSGFEADVAHIGVLVECTVDCDFASFPGPHRWPCRGIPNLPSHTESVEGAQRCYY